MSERKLPLLILLLLLILIGLPPIEAQGSEPIMSRSKKGPPHLSPLRMSDKLSRPVILVHGFKDTGRKMQRLARYLQQNGRVAHAVTLRPSFGQAGIDELAKQLATLIENETAPGQPVDLVGFSMGGLVCRYLVQRLGWDDRVGSLVTIASPHRGTYTAYLLARPACRQMRPGSRFLRDLNGDTTALDRVRFLSVWTPLDLMIVPATSSILPVGERSHHWIVAHPLMVWQSSVSRDVRSFLDAPEISQSRH